MKHAQNYLEGLDFFKAVPVDIVEQLDPYNSVQFVGIVDFTVDTYEDLYLHPLDSVIQTENQQLKTVLENVSIYDWCDLSKALTNFLKKQVKAYDRLYNKTVAALTRIGLYRRDAEDCLTWLPALHEANSMPIEDDAKEYITSLLDSYDAWAVDRTLEISLDGKSWKALTLDENDENVVRNYLENKGVHQNAQTRFFLRSDGEVTEMRIIHIRDWGWLPVKNET
jgi:hypothetical protein